MSSPESYFSSSQWTLLDQCLRLMSNWIGELKGQATGYSGYPCMPIRCILQISHPISITITCFYLHGCCLTCWIVVPFCFWFASFCILTYNHHHWLSHTLGGSCAKCDYFSQPTHVLVGLTCFLPIRYSTPFSPLGSISKLQQVFISNSSWFFGWGLLLSRVRRYGEKQRL